MGYKTAFQSVYTLLNNNADLKAKAKVYDFVPEDATSPYIQIQLGSRINNQSEMSLPPYLE